MFWVPDESSSTWLPEYMPSFGHPSAPCKQYAFLVTVSPSEVLYVTSNFLVKLSAQSFVHKLPGNNAESEKNEGEGDGDFLSAASTKVTLKMNTVNKYYPPGIVPSVP